MFPVVRAGSEKMQDASQRGVGRISYGLWRVVQVAALGGDRDIGYHRELSLLGNSCRWGDGVMGEKGGREGLDPWVVCAADGRVDGSWN